MATIPRYCSGEGCSAQTTIAATVGTSTARRLIVEEMAIPPRPSITKMTRYISW